MTGLRCLAAANLAALVVLWGLEQSAGELWCFTTLLTYAPQHPFGIPSAGLLAWSAARRDGRSFLLAAAAACFFLLALMGLRVPLRVPRGAEGVQLRVMTFNIRSAWDGLEGVVAAIRDVDPDILCLQEADIWSATLPHLEVLPRRLPGYHNAAAESLQVLSRYPITAHKLYTPTPEANRALLEVTLNVDGRPLSVLTAHFTTAARLHSLSRPGGSLCAHLRETSRLRAPQAETAAEIARRMKPPSLFAGDLNTPPRGQMYRRLAEPWRNAFQEAGWGFGFTYPARWPLLRIDHIFVSRGIHIARCWVPRTQASDHRPVVADLVVTAWGTATPPP
ncbi:MAG: endonuclease/exonuclease/phosphatase family protein [Armatimonadota bacterium]|nr:endonuclease/exonuclease/phosphatase family protein [Armatimonadota bacterium]